MKYFCYLAVQPGIVKFTRSSRDISISSLKLLKCQRAQLVNVTVRSELIVETPNKIKYVQFGFSPENINAAFDSLLLLLLKKDSATASSQQSQRRLMLETSCFSLHQRLKSSLPTWLPWSR